MASNYICGTGGHSIVVYANLKSCGRIVSGFFDKTDRAPISGMSVLGQDNDLVNFCTGADFVHIGVGINIGLRQKIFDTIIGFGLNVGSSTHKSAIVEDNVELGFGVQMMAGAILQPRSKIGSNVVINTGAIVEHDCIVGSHSFISPGAIVCGGVKIGERCFVGAGAKLLPGANIADNTFIKAGKIVI